MGEKFGGRFGSIVFRTIGSIPKVPPASFVHLSGSINRLGLSRYHRILPALLVDRSRGHEMASRDQSPEGHGTFFSDADHRFFDQVIEKIRKDKERNEQYRPPV